MTGKRGRVFTRGINTFGLIRVAAREVRVETFECLVFIRENVHETYLRCFSKHVEHLEG